MNPNTLQTKKYNDLPRSKRRRRKKEQQAAQKIEKALKQPQVKQQTATIVTFVTTPPETQLFQTDKPAEAITLGNLGAAIDGTKSIIKRKILAGAKTTVPAQFETKAATVAVAEIKQPPNPSVVVNKTQKLHTNAFNASKSNAKPRQCNERRRNNSSTTPLE